MSRSEITLLDGYDGHLPQPRTAAQFSTAHAIVTKIAVGEMNNNVYLVECQDSDAVVLIDAANDGDELIRFLRKYRSMRGLQIITTHSHFDHVQALAQLRNEFDATTIASVGDADDIDVATDRTVTQGDRVEIGRCGLEVISLRGHTTEGIALVLRDTDATHIFTGDSLFPGGPGKTHSPEAFTQLMDDLEERIFAVFDDATVFHPGHGDDSTLGAERPHLGEWRERGW